jgi:hypothetical protein
MKKNRKNGNAPGLRFVTLANQEIRFFEKIGFLNSFISMIGTKGKKKPVRFVTNDDQASVGRVKRNPPPPFNIN